MSGVLRLELFGHLRDGREEVSNQAKVGDLEDRGLRVLVDASNHLGVLHSGQVLDGARDSHGNVQLGGDDLSGLSNLGKRRRQEEKRKKKYF